VEIQTLGKQLLRSGTSVGAHYRGGCRAKSDADFVSKIEGALQELEESAYWLELLIEIKPDSNNQFLKIIREIEELTAIFVTIVKKVKGA